MTFTNYQLYRTTPKLSGNMKLDVVVYSRGSELIINDFHLRPLSNLIPYNDIDEDIMLQDDSGNYVRPHQYNIKQFYEATKSSFYQAKADPQLLSDWPIVFTKEELIKRANADVTLPVKTWDDTYWAGTQRMSYHLYNTTHELLIPVWFEKIEDISKLSIEIGLVPTGGNYAFIKKTLRFKKVESSKHHKFHNRFCDYLNDYFKYTGITEGNNKCININLRDNITQLYGLNVQDGNMQTRTDFNLTRNLLFRERPLLENNSLITNTFSDVHLILPQLINFNICFDSTNWIPKDAQNLYTQALNIQATVLIDGKPIETYDLFTNHQYIPRPINEDIYSSHDWLPELTYNALDYKHDYLCVDLMHANKIVQPICHWTLRDNTNILFNLYDGFGSSYKDSLCSHFFGNVNDPYNTLSDPVIPNTSPFGPKRIGDGDEVDYVLDNIEHFTFDDPYFIELSKGWVNGFRMMYEPAEDDEIQEILVAGMTTDPNYTRELKKTPDTQTVTNTEYFAVWAARYDKNGNNTLINLKYNSQDNRDINSHDYKYDVARYRDMDNRWYKYIEEYINFISGPEPDPELLAKVPNSELQINDLYGPGYFTTIGNSIIDNINTCRRYISKYGAMAETVQQMAVMCQNCKEYLEARLCDALYAYTNKKFNNDLELGVDLSSNNTKLPGWGGVYAKHRLEINSYGMYFCIKKINWPKAGKDKKAIALLIWDQTTDANDSSEHLIYKKKLSFQNIGFIMECLREYVKWVKTHIDMRWFKQSHPTEYELFSALDLFNTVTINSEMPGVWSFYNTITSYQDNSVSPKAAEIVYKKDTINDIYVYRFDGPLKPAMYPPAVRRNENNESGFEYSKLFGINYLWFKKTYGYESPDWTAVQKKDNTTAAQDWISWTTRDRTEEYSDLKLFNMYSKSGVPPKFPSLRYDSVITDSEYGPNLLYDEPISVAADNFKEYKWFNKSQIVQYPIYIEAIRDLESIENKKELRSDIKNIMIGILKERTPGELFDKDYINSIYDVNYELLHSKRNAENPNKLLYTYKITMKLK